MRGSCGRVKSFDSFLSYFGTFWTSYPTPSQLLTLKQVTIQYLDRNMNLNFFELLQNILGRIVDAWWKWQQSLYPQLSFFPINVRIKPNFNTQWMGGGQLTSYRRRLLEYNTVWVRLLLEWWQTQSLLIWFFHLDSFLSSVSLTILLEPSK